MATSNLSNTSGSPKYAECLQTPEELVIAPLP